VRTISARKRHGLTLLALAVSTSALAAPSVKDVMRRVGAYVDAYGERASIVVATEDYKQEARGNTDAFHGERSTVAEFAIVKIDAVTAWQGFRDVLSVDGVPVEGRRNRLIDSLLSGPGGYIEARRLSDESSRFNIGIVERNFNVPTTAMFFFRSESHDRFKFAAKEPERGIWRIAWRETHKPTFIRSPSGASVPAEGELWVDPADGTIRRTVLAAAMQGRNNNEGSGRVDVTYRYADAIGMWLPSVMDEEWMTTAPMGKWERVSGHAVYSNYRQFTTSGRIK
jgi:hypothetical protein